jgi:hypothetical protein
MLFDLIHKAVPWQGWDRYRHEYALDLVAHFTFGDTYCVVFNSGMTVVLPNLEALLSAIAAEFRTDKTRLPLLFLGKERKSSPLQLTLQTRNVHHRDAFNPEELVDAIRCLCTTYSLSGEWDEQTLDSYNALVAAAYPRPNVDVRGSAAEIEYESDPHVSVFAPGS